MKLCEYAEDIALLFFFAVQIHLENATVLRYRESQEIGKNVSDKIYSR